MAQFIAFLNDMQSRTKQHNLFEAIKQGYRAICEGEIYPPMQQPMPNTHDDDSAFNINDVKIEYNEHKYCIEQEYGTAELYPTSGLPETVLYNGVEEENCVRFDMYVQFYNVRREYNEGTDVPYGSTMVQYEAPGYSLESYDMDVTLDRIKLFCWSNKTDVTLTDEEFMEMNHLTRDDFEALKNLLINTVEADVQKNL